MRVTKPSKNRITQGYRLTHKAYDFSGKGDEGIYACLKGKVVISRDRYSTSWLQGGSNDPTPWGLTTEDYGNFIKVDHGGGLSSLYAHLRHYSPVSLGTKVEEGDRIALVGHTGNSTARHLHFEFRNPTNTKVEFKGDPMAETVSVPKEKFEELVKKSSKYDEFKNAGFENAAFVINLIQDYKQGLKDKDETIKREESRATAYRDELNDFVATLADPDHFNTTQDTQEILTRAGAIGTKLTQLEDLQATFAGLQQSAGKTESDLRAQIAVLKEELKLNRVVEGLTDNQLLVEYLKRKEEFIISLIKKLKDTIRKLKGR